jgi:hypothetical protein
VECIRHRLHYTLEEARDKREWVAARVRAAQSALDVLQRREARGAIAAMDPNGGGGWPGRDVAAATLQFQRAIAELNAADIVVRDVFRGLVDFPAVRDGDEVYLCWLVDEPEIGWWHDLDSGFGGRRRLEGRPEH